MAQHNANHTIVALSSGINGPEICGNGITASTIHEVYCTSGGTVGVTAFGGGGMTVALTPGESIKVLCSSIDVQSGTFVGFKTAHKGFNNRLLG